MTQQGLADWRQTHFLPITEAARILGVSRAQLYKHQRMGRIKLVRSLGRVVLRTEDVIRIADAATAWTPASGRNAPALAALKSRRRII